MKILRADNHFALVMDFVVMHCFSRLSSQLNLLTYAAITECFQYYYLSENRGREKRKLEAIRIRILMYLPNSVNIRFGDATSGFKLTFAGSLGLIFFDFSIGIILFVVILVVLWERISVYFHFFFPRFLLRFYPILAGLRLDGLKKL